MGKSSGVSAFAALEAIAHGEWDDYLVPLHRAVTDREQALDPRRRPSKPLLPGKHWVWHQADDTPHWEQRDN